MKAKIRTKQECSFKSLFKDNSVLISKLINKSIRIFKCIFGIREKLTYEERVSWFFNNYYETGMELNSLMKELKNHNLDNYKWYDDYISFPKYLDET